MEPAILWFAGRQLNPLSYTSQSKKVVNIKDKHEMCIEWTHVFDPSFFIENPRDWWSAVRKMLIVTGVKKA